MKHVSIQQSLQYVANYPQPITDETIQLPTHELVSRVLFDIANLPDHTVRGSMARANKARKMIMERLVGKRKPGSRPVNNKPVDIEFVDLTGGELSGAEE